MVGHVGPRQPRLLREADGDPYRVVGVLEDITEHLRLQRPSTRCAAPRRPTAPRASSCRA